MHWSDRSHTDLFTNAESQSHIPHFPLSVIWDGEKERNWWCTKVSVGSGIERLESTEGGRSANCSLRLAERGIKEQCNRESPERRRCDRHWSKMYLQWASRNQGDHNGGRAAGGNFTNVVPRYTGIHLFSRLQRSKAGNIVSTAQGRYCRNVNDNIAKFSDSDAAADSLSKWSLICSSFMASILTFWSARRTMLPTKRNTVPHACQSTQ